MSSLIMGAGIGAIISGAAAMGVPVAVGAVGASILIGTIILLDYVTNQLTSYLYKKKTFMYA